MDSELELLKFVLDTPASTYKNIDNGIDIINTFMGKLINKKKELLEFKKNDKQV
mgnify:CR=1 FL=1